MRFVHKDDLNEILAEFAEDIILLTEYESALIGIIYDGANYHALYSRHAIIDIYLMQEQHMDEIDAIEWFDTMIAMYPTENTPMFLEFMVVDREIGKTS